MSKYEDVEKSDRPVDVSCDCHCSSFCGCSNECLALFFIFSLLAILGILDVVCIVLMALDATPDIPISYMISFCGASTVLFIALLIVKIQVQRKKTFGLSILIGILMLLVISILLAHLIAAAFLLFFSYSILNGSSSEYMEYLKEVAISIIFIIFSKVLRVGLLAIIKVLLDYRTTLKGCGVQ
ncbi:hypothetical protein PFISCL1PPCAC_24530 [Pristionchus fissidentatus]|uniref:G protein-coupled receptor n=1 Tax=Pristionchus fissidentatus TaxID=1538716 RepID=A0AAV5WRI6_9BILA|nr:hypothetical protein PFISCL1PPCAC_24530 [Pristionchus fissidentatus]